MKRLKKYQKNIVVGDKLICRYYNEQDGRYYGSFFDVSVLAVGVDTYLPVRDFVGTLKDGRIVTLWLKEIQGITQ